MATFYLKEGDTSPTLEATLRNPDGTPADVSNADVTIRVAEPRGGATLFTDTVDVISGSEGKVAYTFKERDVEKQGRYRLDFHTQIVNDGGESYPNSGYHTLMVDKGL